jgi:response regulator RpfG family c-di-GMP phosphodiesterase
MSAIQPTILVIDDEKYICKIVVESLGAHDVNVVSFNDPAEGITYLKNHPIDLVLTDLVMGEFSGVEVMSAAMEVHPDAIVILMTAHPTIQTAISVLTQGAYDFLVKPFKLDVLHAAIRRGLAHQQILRQNLTLKSQVAFLKVANAVGSGLEIDKFLDLVLSSCKTELSAAAAALIEIDPVSSEVHRKMHLADDGMTVDDLLDDANLLHFSDTQSVKPVVRTEHTTTDGERSCRITIIQPIFIQRRLHGGIALRIHSRFDRVTSGQLDALAILANTAGSAIANNRLYVDLQASYLQAIRALANAIEARDAGTAGHTDRVSRLATLVATQLGWSPKRLRDLSMGCVLHDIGKIGVPDSILNKAGRLTDEERDQMNNHPMVGLKIINGIDLLRPAVPYISSHHERFDGLGYPRGLAGEEIPLEGRLLAVVDTFDAILSDRPYRKGAPLVVALRELILHRDSQFDPRMVDVFIDLLKTGRIDLKELYGREEEMVRVSEIIDEIVSSETARQTESAQTTLTK